MKKTVFLHVPKTGGTTLNYVLENSLSSLIPQGQMQVQRKSRLDGQYVKGAQVGSLSYLSGHLPAGILATNTFERSITIIREPVGALASMFNFLENNPKVQEGESFIRLAKGEEWCIYHTYFAPQYQSDRFLLDESFGLDGHIEKYAVTCTPELAFETLKKFNYVIDFNELDLYIKKLIILDRLFPFSNIPKARSKHYNKQEVMDLIHRSITDFDIKFYNLYRDALDGGYFKLPPLKTTYEDYRHDYAATEGHTLERGTGKRLDLELPIGLGWYSVEKNEENNNFRWSEPNATIEIPIGHAGSFSLVVYCNPWGKKIEFGAILEAEGVLTSKELIEDSGLTRLEFKFNLKSFGWIVIYLSCSANEKNIGDSNNDLRDIGITLGGLYLFSHSSDL